MDDTKSVSELKKSAWNPRKISDFDFENLVNSMQEFGDLSGIIKNVETGELVGGHQRLEAFKRLSADQIIITHRYDAITPIGTTALGYVLMPNGEQFSYREVSWPIEKQKAANVAANRIQGDWDLDLLGQLNYDLANNGNASLLQLTGQSQEEITDLLNSVGVGEPKSNAEPPEPRMVLRVECESDQQMNELYTDLKQKGYNVKLG